MPTIASLLRQPLPSAVSALAVAQSQHLELLPDGSVYPVQVSDYAAQANTGNTLAATSLTNNLFSTTVGSILAQSTDGSFYLLAASSGSTGAAIIKYSAAGLQLGSITLVSSSNTEIIPYLAMMANGNIVAAFVDPTVGDYSWEIVTPQLQSVASGTNFATAPCNSMAMIALSGGGFAMLYYSASTTLTLNIFGPTGTSLHTATMTASASSTLAMVQLSNTNIALTYSNTTLQIAIYDITATQVLAPASTAITVSNDLSATTWPYLVIISGFFCVTITDGSGNLFAIVYSNAGVKQGSTFTATTATSGCITRRNLVTDGLNFFVVYSTVSPSAILITRLSSAGVSTASPGLASFIAAYNGWVCCCDQTGTLSIFAIDSTVGSAIASFNTKLMQFSLLPVLVSTLLNYAGAFNFVTLAGGDGAVIIAGQNGTTSAVLAIYKTANTAILGPALAAATAGSSVVVDTTSGYKQIVAVLGTPSKSYDHSATTIHGNKGSIVNNATTQSGI